MEPVHSLPFESLHLLKKELKIAGINLKQYNWSESDEVLEEINHVLVPRIHEGMCYSYGVILAENKEDLEDHPMIRMSRESIHLARKMANGEEWFILYHQTEFLGLIRLDESYSNEKKLIQNFPISGGIIAHRNRHGVSKFYMGDSFWIHEQRNWSYRPNIKKASSNISHCFENLDKKIMNQILEFSFYLLSPSPKTGAILIWHARNGINHQTELRKMDLNLMDDTKKKLIFHLLSQTDGATMIDQDGKVIEYGIHLHNSRTSTSIIQEFKGSRHTTSKRASYDMEGTVVFTVSEDGPVSIFINGVNITDLDVKTAHRMSRELLKKQPELSGSLTANSFIKLCDHCKRTSMIEEVMINNLNNSTAVFCPTCDKTLHRSKGKIVNCRPFSCINST